MTYSPATGLHIYGDGSDGAATIGVDTTVARDMYYTDLTVSAGFNVNTAGFKILVRGTLTVAGTIHNDGVVGGTAASDSTFSPGGAAPYNAANTSLGVGQAGASGRYNTVGDTGVSFSTDPVPTVIGAGGAGGTGSTTAGGAAGGSTSALARYGNFRAGPAALLGLAVAVTSTPGTIAIWKLSGGWGGGGGGGDNTRAGGGGGCGGGPIVICARRIVVPVGGAIRSKGGDGGPARAGGNSGGGGGSGGGPIILVYDSLTEAGSITAPGGAGGAKTGTGIAGTAGGAGSIIRLSNQ
jgi:hypothetical protein